MSQVPSVPPTREVLGDLPPEPPRWPKVVGITSIVWGSIGVACGICGSVSWLMMPAMLKPAEERFGPAPDVMRPTLVQQGLVALSLPLAVMLIVAGVSVLRRRATGRPLHLAYAGLSLPLTLLGTAAGVVQLLAQMEWVRNNGDSPWAKQMNPAFGIGGLAMGLVLGAAWPAFCLVWFGAMKKRPEEGWDDESTLV